MKLIAKPVDMVAWFTQDGEIHPVRFRIMNHKEVWQTIKVNHIVSVNHEKKAGNPVIIYTCQSMINGVCKIYELRYERNTCSWTLYKI